MEKIMMYACFLLPVYGAFRLSRFEKGVIKYIVLAVLMSLGLAGALLLDRPWVFFVADGMFLLAFTFFYDEEPFRWKIYILIPLYMLSMLAALLLPALIAFPVAAGGGLFLIWLWRKQMVVWRAILLVALFGLMTQVSPLWLAALLTLLVFALLDGIVLTGELRFAEDTERFQHQLLANQYEEIKEVYLQMRGWRHDYHNHLQSMKAHLAAGETKALARYLDELEHDLDSVDRLVNSGNLMVDAILNSKLSLATKQLIDLDVTVKVLPVIPIADVDLCVILGNLLDNAIESCEKIPAEDRFIRLYMENRGEQLYLSIQNAAKEELNFDERHYISTKRGHHGLGMKRVSLLIDKYDGFLNLQNEPGIFATEVSIPL